MYITLLSQSQFEVVLSYQVVLKKGQPRQDLQTSRFRRGEMFCRGIGGNAPQLSATSKS